MGDVYMSAEVIAIVAAFATLGIGMFAGFAWLIRRIDGLDQKLTTRIDGMDQKLTARIDGVEEKLTARIDGVDQRLGGRIDGVKDELTEVKIALARIEPPRHLVGVR